MGSVTPIGAERSDTGQGGGRLEKQEKRKKGGRRPLLSARGRGGGRAGGLLLRGRCQTLARGQNLAIMLYKITATAAGLP